MFIYTNYKFIKPLYFIFKFKYIKDKNIIT